MTGIIHDHIEGFSARHSKRDGASDWSSSTSSPRPSLAHGALVWQGFGLEIAPKERNDRVQWLAGDKEVARCMLSMERVGRHLELTCTTDIDLGSCTTRKKK
jgi:hypothetical protein